MKFLETITVEELDRAIRAQTQLHADDKATFKEHLIETLQLSKEFQEYVTIMMLHLERENSDRSAILSMLCSAYTIGIEVGTQLAARRMTQ